MVYFFSFISRPQGESGEGREMKGKKQTDKQQCAHFALVKEGNGYRRAHF
jgi:hypothetical protein